MGNLLICYPKCTTCQRAKQWLVEQDVRFEERHIVTANPTASELKQWHQKSGLPLKRFFNTSGNLYKEQNLKERLGTMTEDEQFALLATNGMLVKRPLLLGKDFVLVGFKADAWEKQRAAMEEE